MKNKIPYQRHIHFANTTILFLNVIHCINIPVNKASYHCCREFAMVGAPGMTGT